MTAGIFSGSSPWKPTWRQVDREPPPDMTRRTGGGFRICFCAWILLAGAFFHEGDAFPTSVEDPAPLSTPDFADANGGLFRRRPEKPDGADLESLRDMLERSRKEIGRLHADVRGDAEKIEELRRVVCRLSDALCHTKGSPCLPCPWPMTTTPVPTTPEPTTTTTTAKTTTAEPTTTTTTSTTSKPTTTGTTGTTGTTTVTQSTTAPNVTTTMTTTTTTTTPKPTPDPKAKCDDPKPPENGYIVGNETTLGSEVQVKCKKGFQLVGVPTMQCTALWNDETHSYSFNWAPPMSAVCKAKGTFVAPHKKKPEEKPEKNVKEK